MLPTLSRNLGMATEWQTGFLERDEDRVVEDANAFGEFTRRGTRHVRAMQCP
jgi:hypothetical protein